MAIAFSESQMVRFGRTLLLGSVHQFVQRLILFAVTAPFLVHDVGQLRHPQAPLAQHPPAHDLGVVGVVLEQQFCRQIGRSMDR